MAGLSDWINGDNWSQIKTKFSAIVDILNGGTNGQFFGSNGAGNMPSWKTFVPEILGGTEDDILIKLSPDDNDYEWGKGVLPHIESFSDDTSHNIATTYTTAAVGSPNDGRQRNNLISFSSVIYGDNPAGIRFRIKKGGVTIKTVNFSVEGFGSNDVNNGTPFSYSFLDSLANPNSVYTVELFQRFKEGADPILSNHSLTIQSTI